VVALRDIHKSYGDNHVYRGVDVSIRRGERVALAGPNGAGKSTLLRIIAGALPFDSGERTVGHNVEVAFFTQHQLEALVETRTVLEELAAEARTEDVPRLRGQLGAFLFSGEDVDKKIGVLSGGEKARVALAKLLLRPVNLVVLDEPTNHLDIASCEVLERALQSYQGTLVFVSHDRAFINALATRVIEVSYGVLREFSGNYDDYLHRVAQLDARPRPDTTPKRETAADRTAPATMPGQPRRAEARASEAPVASKQDRQQDRARRKNRDKTARRVAKIEEEIHEKERALEALDWRLGDPSVYSEPEALTTIQAEQTALRETIAGLYAEWERESDELAALEDLLAD